MGRSGDLKQHSAGILGEDLLRFFLKDFLCKWEGEGFAVSVKLDVN